MHGPPSQQTTKSFYLSHDTRNSGIGAGNSTISQADGPYDAKSTGAGGGGSST